MQSNGLCEVLEMQLSVDKAKLCVRCILNKREVAKVNLKKSSKACIVAMVFTVTAVHPSWGVPVLQNSGFETASTNNPGGAANWYGYTFSSDGGVGTAVVVS